MNTLTIIARIEAVPDKTQLVKEALMKLLNPTRKETGCLQYDLHQDTEHPEVFVFVENWQSRTLWQDHMNNDHLKAYIKATEGAVASFTLNEMTQIN